MSVTVPLRTALPVTAASAPHPRGRTVSAITVLLLALAGSVVAAVAIGPADVAPAELAASVWSHLTGAATGLTRSATRSSGRGEYPAFSRPRRSEAAWPCAVP